MKKMIRDSRYLILSAPYTYTAIQHATSDSDLRKAMAYDLIALYHAVFMYIYGY